ncbi:hypothetical protein C7377_0123 [Balneicella halophila]|uniref:Lipoprotein n=1 Tax=Balneicella halophila TaxID=1537566 RepID=A0A7L4UQ14_BALHA|nr:hypothetical protein [Balneicella halophila]PVX51833.1 hypothetical protein C7377_0123 [Balneicella halophila]
MKKYLLLGVALVTATLLLQSCFDDDDDYINYGYFVTPFDSISMPDTADFGGVIKITTYTKLKDKCQAFYTFDYKPQDSIRTVSAIAIQYDEEEVACGEEKTIAPVLDFNPIRSGNYKFKFWAGKDTTTNTDIFITKDIHIKMK